MPKGKERAGLFRSAFTPAELALLIERFLGYAPDDDLVGTRRSRHRLNGGLPVRELLGQLMGGIAW